jgi:peptidoglycan/xylan/chitin deacetylase (PgdA/CDA1 family)
MHPYLYELTLYLKNGYPPFVHQKKPSSPKDYIPVFISHSVRNEEFEEKLIFLHENHYKTITVTELYNLLKNNICPGTPTVCLTFDDGHESLYGTAYPLLKKYGFCATAFITPAFIGNKKWVTWEQIIEMSKSEIIDIQSHGFDHKRIFVSDKIISPTNNLFKNELGLDRPSIILNGNETTNIPSEIPIYEMDSRMSNRLRFLGDRYETPEEQKQDIKNNLALAKNILETKLGKQIEHFAYPWGLGSKLSQEASKETGYLTNFWGPLPGIPYNNQASDYYKLVRLKDDYIFRLPGKNRKSLLTVFSLKIKRRQAAKEKNHDIY